MGFRFRKAIKIAPGVRVNLGKRGTSVSVGRRGATVNVGKRGVRTTVGLPGTGLSYSDWRPWKSAGAGPGTTRPTGGPPRTLHSATDLCGLGLMAAAGVIALAGRWATASALVATGAALLWYGRLRRQVSMGAPVAPVVPASLTGAAATAVTLPATLPSKAAAIAAPLIAERDSLNQLEDLVQRRERLHEIDHELTCLRNDLATSPWRYRD